MHPAAEIDRSDTGNWLTLAGAAGAALGLFGLVAVALSPSAAGGVLGALLLVGGVVQLIELLRRLGAPGRTLRGLLALIYLGGGAALLADAEAARSLPRLVAVLFVGAGAVRIAWGLSWGRWRAMVLIAGLGVAAFGVLVFLTVPEGPVLQWLGVAAGVDLAAYGVSALLLGRALRH